MRKKKKLLLVFFTTIILSLQIFYVIAFAAVPSFYPLYWDAVFRATNFYTFNYENYLPQVPHPVNKVDILHYYDESEGSFVYTGPFSPYEISLSTKSVMNSPFNGDYAGINGIDGNPVTNVVMYEVPINLSSANPYNLNITFTWYGSNAWYIKLNSLIDGQNYAALVPFSLYDSQNFRYEKSYAYSAVVRIYAYDSLGNYTLIPSTNVRFGDLYYYDGPCNPNYYNGEANFSTMSARDIEIFDYNVTDLEYLQVYILSNNYGVGQSKGFVLFNGAMSNGNTVSSFRVGDSDCCYFQRFGVKSSNFAEVIVPPTDEELILDGVSQIGNKLDDLYDSLTIPNQIQAGIVNAQRDKLDNIGSDLEDMGASLSGDGFFVEKGEVVHNNRFMNLFDEDHFNNSLGRVFDASVVIRLFFLMITFGLMSYVLFGKAAG